MLDSQPLPLVDGDPIPRNAAGTSSPGIGSPFASTWSSWSASMQYAVSVPP
jgi:hypothetical protein